MSLAPESNCMIMDEVTRGEIPNSMRDPLLEARITLIQQNGSEPVFLTIPQRGIWQQRRYINTTMAVQICLLSGVILPGAYSISGMTEIAGRIKCKSLVPYQDLTIFKVRFFNYKYNARMCVNYLLIQQLLSNYYQLQLPIYFISYSYKGMRKTSEALELKLRERIVQRLQKINSFGYKVINNSELQVINKYYSAIYGQTFNFKQQNMHFFGSYQTMYAYLILGLTNVGEAVLVSESINQSIFQCILGLNRKILKIKFSELSTILENKNIKPTLLVLSNPDFTTGSVLGKEAVKNVLQLCNQNGIAVICDESMSTICPHQDFYSSMSEQYNRLVLIQQIGTLSNKYIAFFGATEVKDKIEKSAAKSLKILPSDLTLALIHASMSEDGLKYRQQLVKNMRANSEQFRKFMVKLKYQSSKCQSQYFMINANTVKSQISECILKFLPSEQITLNEQRYIRIDLNCQIEHFREGIRMALQSMPAPKL